MTSMGWVLWGGAVVGVAANAWLVASSASRTETASAPYVEATRSECGSSEGRPAGDAQVGCERELLACAELFDGCSSVATQCADEAVTNAELHERFRVAGRSSVTEARIAPLLAIALGPIEGTTWQHECRGSICRIEIEGDSARAEAALQVELRPMIELGSFAAAATDTDESSHLVVHLELHPHERVDAMPLLIDLQQRFEGTDRFATCSPDEGTFNVRIDLDEEDGGLTQYGGSLANTDAGRCLVARLEHELARTDIPAHHTGATRFLRYRFPLDAP